MNRLLLILLLATNTCTAQWVGDDICDSVVSGAYKVWEEYNVVNYKLPGKYIVKYKYDTTKTLHVDLVKQYLMLYSRDNILLAEGTWDNYWCGSPRQLFYVGEWKIYYPSGKLQRIGVWERKDGSMETPVRTGRWFWYYENGFIKKECNYRILQNDYRRGVPFGYYCEYYRNGTVAQNGCYDLRWYDAEDSVWVVDPETQEEKVVVKKALRKISVKTGIWRYYNKDGTLKYKEEYP